MTDGVVIHRLFGAEDAVTCFVCYHHEHPGSVCYQNDDAWLDPMAGGDPANTPRSCGCAESVNRAQCNAIVIPAPEKVPFHCANNCPIGGQPDDSTDLYPCGYRHWCPWCGDCEFCYDEGPHEWD